LNLALDYLPGSVMFDPAAGDKAEAMFASRVVWFDSFILNVDRTANNANLLCWHKDLHLIDHGAAFFFQHNWQNIEYFIETRFNQVRRHLLLKWASKIEEAAAELRPKLNESVF